jgi:hypothetical protein
MGKASDITNYVILRERERERERERVMIVLGIW